MEQRPDSRTVRTRARILAAARETLTRRPEAGMDEIAVAAGVVRRTLYGHFSTRDELVVALISQAGDIVLQHVDRPDDDRSPTWWLARMTVQAWSVGHHLRLLLAVVRRAHEASLSEALAPLGEAFAEVIERGQRDGEFHAHVPPAVMARVLEAQAMTLHEAFDDGAWTGTAMDVAVLALITLGVPARAALDAVDSLDDAQPSF